MLGAGGVDMGGRVERKVREGMMSKIAGCFGGGSFGITWLVTVAVKSCYVRRWIKFCFQFEFLLFSTITHVYNLKIKNNGNYIYLKFVEGSCLGKNG